jgi:hypothetical protein
MSIFVAVINHSFHVLHRLYVMKKLTGRTNHNKHGLL